MDTSGFIKRLQQLMDENQVNPSGLANKIGVQRSTFSHILNGRNKPSVELLVKIHNEFPTYSIDWLLFGTNSPTPPPQTKLELEEEPPITYASPSKTDIATKKTEPLPTRIVVLKSDGTFEYFQNQ